MRPGLCLALVLCLPACICPAGEAECGGACFALETSDEHCGACGITCGPRQHCVDGACRCDEPCGSACPDFSSDEAHCGGCGVACAAGGTCEGGTCVCPSGTTRCGASCVDLATSELACGRCDVACPPSAWCEAGTCRCPDPLVRCGGRCVDLSTDPLACGTCTTTCDAPTTCVGGACECVVAGEVPCGDVCVDLTADSIHCGACFRGCSAPETCNFGACNCGSGRELCSGSCVDLRRDEANCGSCGFGCVAGGFCVSGRCMPEPIWADRVGGGPTHPAAPMDDDGAVAVDSTGSVTLGYARYDSSVIVRHYDGGGTAVWTRAFTTYAWGVSDIAIDPTGRIAVAASWGFRWRTSAGTDRASLGSDDMVVMLLDPADGAVIWERFFGTVGFDRVGDIEFTPTGELVVSGMYDGAMNTGAGTITASAWRDLFVLTLRGADGTTVSAQSYGTIGTTDSDPFVAVAPDGDRYFAGRTGRSGIDLGGGPISGFANRFVARLGPIGEHRWSRGLDVAAIDGLVAGTGDVVYVAGSIDEGTTDFGDGVTVTTPRFRAARFVVALGTGGRALWATILPASYVAASGGIVADLASGALYTLATYAQLSSTMTLPDIGGWDLGLVSLSTLSGIPLWIVPLGSTSDEYGTDLALGGDVLAFAARTNSTSIMLGDETLPRVESTDVVVHALHP